MGYRHVVSLDPKIKDRTSPTRPAGEDKRACPATLEQGSHLLQTDAPMRGFDVCVVGLRCATGQRHPQMEARP